MKFLRILAAGALALVFLATTAIAQTATPPPASTIVDITPFIDAALKVVAPLLVAGVLYLAKRYLGMQANDRDKALVEDLIRNGLALLQAKYGKGVKIDVGRPELAVTLDYVQTHGPDVLKRLGISVSQLEQKAIARWFDPSVPVGMTEQPTDPKPGPVAT